MQATRILPDLQCSLLCEEIRQEVTGSFFLIGVINFIRVPQLPVVAVKLSVFNRWTAGIGQFTESVRLIAPDQTTVLRKGEVKFALQDANLHATNVTVFGQVEFKTAGAYFVEQRGVHRRSIALTGLLGSRLLFLAFIVAGIISVLGDILLLPLSDDEIERLHEARRGLQQLRLADNSLKSARSRVADTRARSADLIAALTHIQGDPTPQARQLREEAGAGVLVEPLPKVVDAGVEGHYPSEENGPRRSSEAPGTRLNSSDLLAISG